MKCEIVLSSDTLSLLKKCGNEGTSPEEEVVRSLTRRDSASVSVNELVAIEGFLRKRRDQGESTPYLHELVSTNQLRLPSYTAPERNPELVARIEQLKKNLANREYTRMTADVNMELKSQERDNFQHDVRVMRSQLIAVVNFVLTVGGSFAFAYKAVEYALPVPNIGAQVLVGVTTATVVAIAEIYFLARYMLN